MKKLIFYIIGFILLASSLSVSALSFNGGSSIVLPSIQTTASGNIAIPLSNTYISDYIDYSTGATPNERLYSSLGCVFSEDGTFSGSLFIMGFSQYSNGYWGGTYDMGAENIIIFGSGSSIYVQSKAKQISNPDSMSPVPIMTIPDLSSGGAYPGAGVACFSVRMGLLIDPVTLGNNSITLYDIKTTIYGATDFSFDKKWTTWTNYSYFGLPLFYADRVSYAYGGFQGFNLTPTYGSCGAGTNQLGSHCLGDSEHPISYNRMWIYDRVSTNPGEGVTGQNASDFLWSTGSSTSVVSTLPNWFGATTVVDQNNNSGSSNGTGGTSNTLATLFDYIYSSFSIVTSLITLPFQLYTTINDSMDNPSNWCVDPGQLEFTSFGSRIVSSFKALFDLANPFIPSEGEVLCHWNYGQENVTYTVHYPRTTNNIVDYFIIVISLLAFFYASSRSLSGVVTKSYGMYTAYNLNRTSNERSMIAQRNRTANLASQAHSIKSRARWDLSRLRSEIYKKPSSDNSQTSLPIK